MNWLRASAVAACLALLVAGSVVAAEPGESPVLGPGDPGGRPVLAAALPMPDGPIPPIDTSRPPDATIEKRGVRMETWVPTEPIPSGAWLPAVVRVTNAGDTPIRHDGDTKNWPYRLPTSTVLDLTGLHDPGRAWDGNAERFKQRFLESQAIARLIMERQPSGDGDEFPDYGIQRRLRPGTSFELPVVVVPRYAWRDQPLPGGTASVDATFCFRRPSAKAGRREPCLRTSAPVTIAGEPVEYPGPARPRSSMPRSRTPSSWAGWSRGGPTPGSRSTSQASSLTIMR